MYITARFCARHCAPLVVTLQRHASVTAPVAATCRRTLAPGQLGRRQCRGLRLCTPASASSGNTSGSAGEDQPLAGDSPPAEIERQEERAIFLGGCSALLLALGLVQVLLPGRLVELAFAASPLPLVQALVRQLGSFFLLAALCSSCLQASTPCLCVDALAADAALHMRLGSDTYQRLLLGVMWWGLASLVTIWASPTRALMRPHLALSALLFITSVVCALVFNQTSPEGLSPPFLLRQLGGSARKLLAPRSVIAGAYGLYTAATAAGAVALWVGTSGAGWVPSWLADAALLSGPLGGLGRRVAQLLGAGLLLLSVVLFTLFDAACRRRLGASTFKTLNIGVLVVSLCATSIAAAQPAHFCCPALASCVVGCTGALAGLAAWQYFLATKK